ncbi:iron ABC transporter ATP-binding protein [Cryobacterium sp.]|uniref:iron ABC transporter ATP-binding protein n=1 Tax=Cryobacterium sp. TaxID=1926290 RepID=UPI0026230530|nr:iron ABC transporter ATP-binding protein [Cryobacterium sp.]MCU1444460.1 iron transporter ATP-binding protein [Cryobacterium sp.]
MTHSSSTPLAPRRSLRTGLALTGATLALIALAGCGPESSAEPTASAAPSATASVEPTATATVEPTATPTPPPAPEGTPVSLTCDQVLTADDVYALNPNLGEDLEYAASSAAAVTATTYGGIACAWLNQSSGEVIEVALAMPNESLANTLKDAALSDGEIVPTYGSAPEVEGYFSASSSTAQVFTRGYWVAVTDPGMIEPGDAGPVLDAVLGKL